METVGGLKEFASSQLSTEHLGCDLWIYRWTCFQFDESPTLLIGLKGYKGGVVTLLIHKTCSQITHCLTIYLDLFLPFNPVLGQSLCLFLTRKLVLFAYCIIESKSNKFIHKVHTLTPNNPTKLSSLPQAKL